MVISNVLCTGNGIEVTEIALIASSLSFKSFKPLRKYYHSGEINRKVKDKTKIIGNVEKKFKSKAQKTLHLDGLSMYFKDWWFSLRESHTEDQLRLNLEANSSKLMQEKKRDILKMIK